MVQPSHDGEMRYCWKLDKRHNWGFQLECPKGVISLVIMAIDLSANSEGARETEHVVDSNSIKESRLEVTENSVRNYAGNAPIKRNETTLLFQRKCCYVILPRVLIGGRSAKILARYWPTLGKDKVSLFNFYSVVPHNNNLIPITMSHFWSLGHNDSARYI